MEKGEYKVNDNVITINGTEYDPSDLSEQQTYWTMQIQDLQQKRQSIQFQIDQISIALDSFTNLLIDSVTNESENIKEKING